MGSSGLFSDFNRLIDVKLNENMQTNSSKITNLETVTSETTSNVNQNISKLNGLGKLTKKFSIYGEWSVYIQGVEGSPSAGYRYIRFIDNGPYEKIGLCFAIRPQDFPIMGANTNPETGQINHYNVVKQLVQGGLVITQQNPEDGVYYQNSFESNSDVLLDLSAFPGGFSCTLSSASLELRFSNNNENFTEIIYTTKIFNNTSQSIIRVGDNDYQYLTAAFGGLEVKIYEDTVLFNGDKRYTITLDTLA